MKKFNTYSKLAFILTACLASSCTLEEPNFEYYKCNKLADGDIVVGNFEASYNYPVEIKEDDATYPNYKDGYCPAKYKNCFQIPESNGVFACSQCENEWMLKCKIDNDNICIDVRSDSQNCGECGMKCNNGHCEDGKCVCELSDESCLKLNKKFIKSKCECVEKEPQKCQGQGEYYDTEAESCLCDTDMHWIGETGSCSCDTENNYVEINGNCVQKAICDETKETYRESDNLCTCDTEKHWIGVPGSCTCDGANDFIELNNECVEKVTCDLNKEIYNRDDNSCICSPDKHRIKSSDNTCICDEPEYIEINEICVKKVNCDPVKEVYNATNNSCGCNIADHWIGTAGSCICDENNDYLEVEGKCIGKTECDSNKETYVKADNTCVCDINKHRVGTKGACTCDTDNNFIEINNECVEKAKCDSVKETYNSSKNTCSCNTSKNWKGTAGKCTCDSDNNYVELNNTCVLKASCDANKEKYVSSTNTCACDTSKHWTGTPGSCVCDASKNYVEINGSCVLKASCDANKEKYVSSTNTCACDTSKHWTGTPGSCKCSFGYTASGSSCAALDLSIGKTLEYGHYEQDNNTSNGKESIQWRILANTGSKILVVSDKPLDVIPYNVSDTDVTWENSTIRSWLNGYDKPFNTDGISYTSNNFINTAFTSDERKVIASATVSADANPKYVVSTGNATTDKIFLLSTKEAETYFKSNDARLADATKYVIKKNAYIHFMPSGNYTHDGTCDDTHCYSTWWLRTPGYNNKIAAIVDFDGSIYYLGNGVPTDTVAVRPALWFTTK